MVLRFKGLHRGAARVPVFRFAQLATGCRSPRPPQCLSSAAGLAGLHQRCFHATVLSRQRGTPLHHVRQTFRNTPGMMHPRCRAPSDNTYRQRAAFATLFETPKRLVHGDVSATPTPTTVPGSIRLSSDLERDSKVLVYRSLHRFEPSCFASVSRALLDAPFRPDVIHRVVLYQRAAQRRGTAHTKTRAEVSGSGRKPWAQKGTGRARAGSLRAPQFRGGGVAHGPRADRIWAQRLPKKVRWLGLASALTRRFQEGRLWVLERWCNGSPQEHAPTNICLDVSDSSDTRSNASTAAADSTEDALAGTSTTRHLQPSVALVHADQLELFLRERGWRSLLIIGASLRDRSSVDDADNVQSVNITNRSISFADLDPGTAEGLWDLCGRLGRDSLSEWHQLERAARNLDANVLLRTSLSVGVYDLVRYPHILITVNALRELELRIRGQSRVLVQAMRLGSLRYALQPSLRQGSVGKP
jgi:50S ribosomal protein L4